MMASAAYGSSPLAWGEVRRPRRAPLVERFIPTRVGRGGRAAAPWPRRSVHPHSRGERPARGVVGRGDRGSSPLAWGEGRPPRGGGGGPRFIPTRVGRRLRAEATPPSRAVHPHSRGERATR